MEYSSRIPLHSSVIVLRVSSFLHPTPPQTAWLCPQTTAGLPAVWQFEKGIQSGMTLIHFSFTSALSPKHGVKSKISGCAMQWKMLQCLGIASAEEKYGNQKPLFQMARILKKIKLNIEGWIQPPSPLLLAQLPSSFLIPQGFCPMVASTAVMFSSWGDCFVF